MCQFIKVPNDASPRRRSLDISVVKPAVSSATAASDQVAGSGTVAIQASWFPCGLIPKPTMVRPLAEMPCASDSVQPARFEAPWPTR